MTDKIDFDFYSLIFAQLQTIRQTMERERMIKARICYAIMSNETNPRASRLSSSQCSLRGSMFSSKAFVLLSHIFFVKESVKQKKKTTESVPKGDFVGENFKAYTLSQEDLQFLKSGTKLSERRLFLKQK